MALQWPGGLAEGQAWAPRATQLSAQPSYRGETRPVGILPQEHGCPGDPKPRRVAKAVTILLYNYNNRLHHKYIGYKNMLTEHSERPTR